MFEELVLVGFTEKMSEYRINRKREQQQNLERLAEDEAELEQLAQDLDTHSQYQKAEVRLKTKLKLIEQEDYEEAKQYVDDLLKQREKTAQEKKEKRSKRIKSAVKIVGITAAVLSLGYVVSRIPSVRAKYDTEYSVKHQEESKYETLAEQLQQAVNIDCSDSATVGDFYKYYSDVTRKEFPNKNLYQNESIIFKIDPAAKSIGIEFMDGKIMFTDRAYKLTLPPQLAEQLISHRNFCSISLE